MQASLRARLSDAESSFLESLSQGSDGLQAFNLTWSQLQTSLSTTISELDTDTLALAHQVFTRVEIIATRFLELEEDAQSVTVDLQNDLAVMFADLRLDEDLCRPRYHQRVSSTDTQRITTPSAPYVPLAYRWLLDNLHNPYPGREIRETIARDTNTTPKDIERWFSSIRKRIGWNALRLKHFSNKRSLIVEAATCCLLDITSPSDHKHSDYMVDFVAIKQKVQTLYDPSLLELANKVEPTDLHTSAKRRTSGDGVNVRAPTIRRPALAYPSPVHSPGSSPAASPSPEPAPDNIRTSRKRRYSSSSSSPERDFYCPPKRTKLHPVDSLAHAAASLPSPAASSPDTAEFPFDSLRFPTSSSIADSLTCRSRKRKRQASEDEEEGPSKRHSPLPHRKSVAIPLTLTETSPFDNWLLENFSNHDYRGFSSDILEPIVAASPDAFTPLEVAAYQYETSPVLLSESALASGSPSAIQFDVPHSPTPPGEKTRPEIPSNGDFIDNLTFAADLCGGFTNPREILSTLDFLPFGSDILPLPFPQVEASNVTVPIPDLSFDWASFIHPQDSLDDLSQKSQHVKPVDYEKSLVRQPFEPIIPVNKFTRYSYHEIDSNNSRIHW